MKNRLISLCFLGIGIFCISLISCHNREKLPIYGERSPIQVMKDGKSQVDTQYFTIPNFRFLNQDSIWVSNQSLKGKIYIADFFFTSCPTICPIMQKNMAKIAETYTTDPGIYFTSFTIDPKHDNITRLKRYQNQLGTKNPHWSFLTGNRDSIYHLAENGFLVTAKTDSTAPGGYVHSGGLVLIDPFGRIRGVYDGTVDEDITRLTEDISILKNEK